MKNSRRAAFLVVALSTVLTAAGASDRGDPMKVGEEVVVHDAKPRVLPQVDRDVRAWRSVFLWPGASYIAVHFDRFDLDPGESVVLATPDGAYAYRFEGEGKAGSGGKFWATHVPGDTCELTYYGKSRAPGRAYAVDKFARGYPEAERSLLAPTDVCGTDESNWAKCYQSSEPTIYDKSRTVLRLLINGTTGCTGFLFGNAGDVMTNNHCIPAAADAMNTDYMIMAEGATCATNCASSGACPGPHLASSGTLIKTDWDLDYSLVHLATNPTGTYGYLRARPTPTNGNERIYLPGHPLFWGKRIGVNSTDPHDESGKCEVAFLNVPGCDGRFGANQISYFCDMQNGSSGSPVIAYTDQQVLAVNNCNGCFQDGNLGVAIQAIVADLQSTNNVPACAVGCDPQVPSLVSPPNGVTGILTAPPLDWNDLVTAASYDVQVATDPAFTAIVASATSLPSSAWTVSPPLSAGTTYYWRARAHHACDACSWSAARSFTTCTTAAPALVTPSDGTRLTTTTAPSLDWTDVVGSTFDVQVATSAAFTTLVRSATGLATSAWTVTPVLPPNALYYWRARAVGACGAASAWSSVRTFELGCALTGAVYDAARRAPGCAASACGCSTGTLVDSRDTLSGKAELNQPNTINASCGDGTNGSYHSTSNGDSVDRVVVRATDGYRLRPGGTAQVDATVWCRNVAGSGGGLALVPPYPADWVDLYYASNAASPSWTLLGTDRCGTGGVSTFSKAITLANVTGTHAVRAQIRYQGSASSCTSGSTNDRDDLTFRVEGLPQQPNLVEAGYAHSIFKIRDATPQAWGMNASGQLGNGGTTDSSSPVWSGALTNVAAVAAGGFHTVALMLDGTVKAWGDNAEGQIGDGSTTNRTLPVTVPGLTGTVAIAAGLRHTLALKSDGTVIAWGDNTFGQIGDGTTTDRTSPVTIGGLTNVIAISAGYYHSAAVTAAGTVVTWGSNVTGQLGDGTHTDRSTPGAVTGLVGVRSVACGAYFTFAILQAGTVSAWGHNYFGELGDGTNLERTTPVPIPGLADVTAIAPGAGFTLALRAGGTVLSAGQNVAGQLGDGTTINRNVFAVVPGLPTVLGIGAGEDHSLAKGSNAGFYGWGKNANGQFGPGPWPQTTPVFFYSDEITGVP